MVGPMGLRSAVISYDMSTFSISTPDSTAWWAREDGILTAPSHEEFAAGDILRDTYYGADGL